jgi:hypothetical protein
MEVSGGAGGPPGRARTGRDLAIAAVLFVSTFAALWASPVQHQSDSRYALLLSETLLRTGRFSLDAHLAAASPRHEGYNLERVAGHVYYLPPPGTSVLSIPFVLALRAFGVSALDRDGRYDPVGEYRAQRIIASALMAALTVLFYRTARLALPISWSLVVALSASFGTQVWSTASRALWSDTWSIALLGYVVWRVAALEVSGRPIRPELLATLLALVFFARPTGAAHALVVFLYVARYHRALLPRLAATGLAWMGVFLAYSWVNFGRALPSYYRFWNLGTSAGWQPLLANLVSPSRGLLLCVPLAGVAVYFAIRYQRALAPALRRLTVLGLAGIVGQLAILAFWYAWWAGHSYGARFTTGTVPWLALLAMAGVRGALDSSRRPTAHRVAVRVERIVAAALVAASVFIQARGALSAATQRWNWRPNDVDRHPDRVWDWRYPQWLAGLAPYPGRTVFPPLAPGEPLLLGPPAADAYLRDGWGVPEEEMRWSEERTARIQFTASRSGPLVLRMRMRPGPAWEDSGSLPLTLELNGRALADWKVRPGLAVYSVPLADVEGKQFLTLRTPDMPTGRTRGDPRPLRAGVEWLRLDPFPPLRPGVAVPVGEPAADPYVGEGWGHPEGTYRWTVAPFASFHLAPEGLRAGVLRMRLHPYPASARGTGQRVYVSVNGDLAATLALRDTDTVRHAVPLPAGLRGADTIVLEMPDARPLGAGGSDNRQLGVAVHSFELDPFPLLVPGAALDLSAPPAEAFLGDGWDDPDAGARSTTGLTADLLFAADPSASTRVALAMEPYPGIAAPQRVRLTLNGQSLGTVTLAERGRRSYEVQLHKGSLLGQNVLRLAFPDARTPAPGGAGPHRVLAVRVASLELRP